MDKRLFFLIYKSIETQKFSTEEVRELAFLAGKKNAKHDITGLLIKKKDSFIQYLEGGKTNITMLYELILKDKRHHSIVLLDKGFIEKRKFSRWSMRLKNISGAEIAAIEKNRTLTKLQSGKSDNHSLVLELINIYKN